MGTRPKVSALIAVCNRPDTIGATIQSVLDQTFQDFEIIVVDDGMERRADKVVAQFNDPRISYIQHTEQRGCAGSRVTGIKAARGKYVAYLDDHDTWMPDKLALQVAAFENAPEDVGFSFTAVEEVYNDRTATTRVPDGADDYYEKALANFSGFLSVTLMFKREVFDEVGLPDASFPSHTDVEFILRIAKKFRGVGINKPLTRVTMKTEGASMATNFTNRIRGREMLLEKHKGEFEKRPKVLANHVFKLGWFYRQNGQYKEARREYARAMRLHFKLRYLLHYLSMFASGFGYRLFRSVKKLLGI